MLEGICPFSFSAELAPPCRRCIVRKRVLGMAVTGSGEADVLADLRSMDPEQ